MCSGTCKHCDRTITRPDTTNPWRAPFSPMPLICSARAGVSISSGHEPARR